MPMSCIKYLTNSEPSHFRFDCDSARLSSIRCYYTVHVVVTPLQTSRRVTTSACYASVRRIRLIMCRNRDYALNSHTHTHTRHKLYRKYRCIVPLLFLTSHRGSARRWWCHVIVTMTTIMISATHVVSDDADCVTRHHHAMPKSPSGSGSSRHPVTFTRPPGAWCTSCTWRPRATSVSTAPRTWQVRPRSKRHKATGTEGPGTFLRWMGETVEIRRWVLISAETAITVHEGAVRREVMTTSSLYDVVWCGWNRTWRHLVLFNEFWARWESSKRRPPYGSTMRINIFHARIQFFDLPHELVQSR